MNTNQHIKMGDLMDKLDCRFKRQGVTDPEVIQLQEQVKRLDNLVSMLKSDVVILRTKLNNNEVNNNE